MTNASFPDKFDGDTPALLDAIREHIAADEDGAFIPNSIGGKARKLLNAAAARLSTPDETNPWRHENVLRHLVLDGHVTQQVVDDYLNLVDVSFEVMGEVFDSPAFERTRDAIKTVPEKDGKQGYVDAFYEVAGMLDIPAMTISPKKAWETVIRPKLAALCATANTSKQAAGEAVAYWLAVTYDGAVEFGYSTDDGNEGKAARQELNDWINEQEHPGAYRLVAAYTTPPRHPADEGMARDARRYAWLRNEAVMAASPDGEEGQMVWAVVGKDAFDVRPIELDELDAAIDAALAGSP